MRLPSRTINDRICSRRVPVAGSRTTEEIPLSMFFIDRQKAYDSVDRHLLWEEIIHFVVPTTVLTTTITGDHS